MKFAAVLLFAVSFAAVASAAYTECQETCMTTAASSAQCGTNYLEQDCLCSNDSFATSVKACLYKSGCGSDVIDFYKQRTTACGSLVPTYTYAAGAASATGASDGSTLSICQTGCMSQAAVTAKCSSTDDNDKSCMCDNDDFASAAKGCLYGGGCGADVGSFFTYRSNICETTSADRNSGVATYPSSTSAYGAQATSVSTATSSSSDGGLSNAASGGIGAAATVAVFAALVAALYAAGMVRFGKKRNEVSLDTASVTSSKYPIKQTQQSRVQHA